MLSTEPRSAYLHIPFCRSKCGYCNFTVVAGHGDWIPRYLACLELELSRLERPRPVDTLFLGGGTPTELPPPALESLLKLVNHWFPLAAGGEFSIEANPIDVNAELAALLVEQGVSRVSLGAQSFSSRKLKLLERDHDRAIIERAAAAIREAGMQLSLDLIFGAPEETAEEWQADLDSTVALAPDHISTYGLTIERGSAFYALEQSGALRKPEEETELGLYLAAIDTLNRAGFEHYEVSNFARPEKRCRHNEVYWLGGEYFAAGPGAARYVSGRRERNHQSTLTWMRRLETGESPTEEGAERSPEKRARERLVLGLRRLEGREAARFEAETGFPLLELGGAPLQRFLARGLMQFEGNRLRLTREGLVISDSLWPHLL